MLVAASQVSSAQAEAPGPGGEYKVANQASRTNDGKPKVASRGGRVSRFAQQEDTGGYWRGDQPRRRGFFGRLFGGP